MRYKIKKKNFIREQYLTIKEAPVNFRFFIKDATTIANRFKHVIASQRDKIYEGLN